MKRERGNILFLILLAVVLFAALSYAVTQSMRGGGNDASKEVAQGKAADLMNYFVSLDTAVQRMRLDGIADYQLNFYYQSDSNFVIGTFDNTNCTDDRCRVFSPGGGNVPGKKMYPQYVNPASPNDTTPERIFWVSVPGAGTSKPDLVYLFHDVDVNICQAVNRAAGLPDMIYSVTYAVDPVNIPYQNAHTTGPVPDSIGSIAVTEAVGNKGTFCFCVLSTYEACTDTAANVYQLPIVAHVLVAR